MNAGPCIGGPHNGQRLAHMRGDVSIMQRDDSDQDYVVRVKRIGNYVFKDGNWYWKPYG